MEENLGGFVASSVQIASLPAGGFCMPTSVESPSRSQSPEKKAPLNDCLPPTVDSLVEGPAVEEATAYAVEFVALPCERDRLRVLIPQLVRDAYRDCKGFSGCVVFISELEARLVTVVTLWQGTGRTKLCREYSERMEQVLDPFVDRWMRAKRLIALLSIP